MNAFKKILPSSILLHAFKKNVASQGVVRNQVRRTMSTKAKKKEPLSGLYNTFFKSNISYVTFIVVGAIVVESLYGTATDYIWENVNRGKLYHHIDWSKFKTDDDDE